MSSKTSKQITAAGKRKLWSLGAIAAAFGTLLVLADSSDSGIWKWIFLAVQCVMGAWAVLLLGVGVAHWLKMRISEPSYSYDADGNVIDPSET